MPIRKTMNVSITPELERLVSDRIATGRYRTASEVVRAALRLLEKEEPFDPVQPHSQGRVKDDVGPGR